MSTLSSSSSPLHDRYIAFIDQVIANTLKGQIRSKDQVYQLLVEQLDSGTSEVFEYCLEEQVSTLQHQLATTTDELKQAKVGRQVRAIKTLQDGWARWLKNHQAQNASTAAVQQILKAESPERLSVLIQVLDPNQANVFNRQHIQQLAKTLQEAGEVLPDQFEAFELRQLALGLIRGLASFAELEGYIISWLYDTSQRPIGFESGAKGFGPWMTWAKHVSSPLPRELFSYQAQNQSATVLAQTQRRLDVSAWVELVVLLRGLRSGLVSWFDNQPYSLQAGRNLAGVTFLEFAMIWHELSQGFQQALQLPESERHRLSQACFQITLQILRTFAQRDNFPLYGGVFASFSGESFRETLTYLDQPLKAVEKTQEKARILTVLGYSQRWIGNQEQAIALYQEALNLARQVGDQRCEVANLNHLSRLSLHQADYNQAVAQAQRALILARQYGDRQGEANALVSLGFSEVTLAQHQEAVTLEQLESSINFLQQGQKLLEKLEDLSSQALCYVGLGIGYVALAQPSQAKQTLEQGLSIILKLGDPDLQALSHAYLGEACYQLNQLEQAVYHTCLGMYFLKQRHNPTWHKAAGLLVIIQGQLGPAAFGRLLEQQRSKLMTQIGVDGFDYLPTLIDTYRRGQES